MTFYRQPNEPQAIEHAAAGMQALHLVKIDLARLYDRDLPRLVETARRFGQRAVRVHRTGTDRQHVEVTGFPLVRAVTATPEATNVELIDLCTAAPLPAAAGPAFVPGHRPSSVAIPRQRRAS